MKKFFRFVACFLALSIAIVCISTSAIASQTDNFESNEIDAVSYFMQYPLDASFGGIFYEGDTLVINYVGDLNQVAVPQMASEGELNIEYRSVNYSLEMLESVKGYLGTMMNEYGIIVLDANEMTNQVDVTLSDFSDESIASIKSLVFTQFGSNDFLNFIDMSGCVIQDTVADECPNYDRLESFVNDVEQSRALSANYYSSMLPIVINSQYLTLGPVVSNQKGYSAGHAGSGSVTGVDDVYKVVLGPGNTWGKGLPLGKAASRFGGKDKDWSVITANVLEKLGPIVTQHSPVMNETVYMWGAVSGVTSGKVTGTNILVTVSGVTLEGMCSGSYSCKKGDSGAGIFDDDFSSGSNTSTCGIQSSASFKSDGTWAGTSYFTPFPLP